MKPLQSKKEIHKLTGRIAAVNRFMSKLADATYHSSLCSRAPTVFNRAQSNRQSSMSSKSTFKTCRHSQVHSLSSHSSYMSLPHTQWSAEPSSKKEKQSKITRKCRIKPSYILFVKPSPAPRNTTQKWKRYVMQWS
jgi:hypothetical protein